jgi:hypothetical protein
MGSTDSLASRGLARLWQSTLAGLSTACFWLAIGLPAAYVPLLGVGLLAGERRALLGLLLVHAVALYLGHEAHDTSTRE